MEGGLNRAGIQLVELFHIVQDGVQLTGEELLFLFGKLQSCQECHVFDLFPLNLHLLPHIYLENRRSLSPLPRGRGKSPALSHCDIPPFRFLYKVGRDTLHKSGRRDAAPALQYRDKDYGIPKRERRQRSEEHTSELQS